MTSCNKLHLPPEHQTRGLPPPYPRSLCPLSSTEFVEPPKQNSCVRHCLELILYCSGISVACVEILQSFRSTVRFNPLALEMDI